MAGFRAVVELSSLDGTNGFRINGEAIGHGFGRSVSSAGDLNGDGFDDLIVGAPYAYENAYSSVTGGSSYVIFGSADPLVNLNVSTLNGSNGFQLTGEHGFGNTGYAVAAAGDVNEDGFDDVIITTGVPNGGFKTTAAYVVFGGGEAAPKLLDLTALDGTDGFKIDTPSASGSKIF
jgi:hypothetical protein